MRERWLNVVLQLPDVSWFLLTLRDSALLMSGGTWRAHTLLLTIQSLDYSMNMTQWNRTALGNQCQMVLVTERRSSMANHYLHILVQLPQTTMVAIKDNHHIIKSVHKRHHLNLPDPIVVAIIKTHQLIQWQAASQRSVGRVHAPAHPTHLVVRDRRPWLRAP